MVSIIDYDMGNLRSVQKGFQKVDVEAQIIRHPEEVLAADHLVLPGVGAFRDAIAALKTRNLIEPIREFVKTGKPLLGICLGMQLFFEKSYEDGEYEGLGLIKGEVIKFQLSDKSLKIPHMGWNSLTFSKPCRLFDQLPADPYVYFVHSFHCCPADRDVVAARTDYGGEFVSVISSDNLFAAQFHPEKSQTIGLQMLKNFASL